MALAKLTSLFPLKNFVAAHAAWQVCNRGICSSFVANWTASRNKEPVEYTPDTAKILLTYLHGLGPRQSVTAPQLWQDMRAQPQFAERNRWYMKRVLKDLRLQGFVRTLRPQGGLENNGYMLTKLPSDKQLQQLHAQQLERKSKRRKTLAKIRINNFMNKGW